MAEKEKPSQIGDHAVIRNAYDNALTAGARLDSFATARRRLSDIHIAVRQEIVARDDLILFAIHTRRLIENTVGRQHANTVKFRAAYDRKICDIAFWRAINVIIHHRTISIIRPLAKGDLEEVLASSGERLQTPTCVVQSDNGKLLGFWIEQLIDAFEDVLEAVVDVCADHRLFLEPDDPC
jgi:hypothetical protein